MPWLGDGTWVDDPDLARDIVRGRTNYRPWSGVVQISSKGGAMSTRANEYTILLARADKATEQRDELLAALKACELSMTMSLKQRLAIREMAHKLIAKVER